MRRFLGERLFKPLLPRRSGILPRRISVPLVKNSLNSRLPRLSVILLIILATAFPVRALTSKVVLSGGMEDGIKDKIAISLTEVINHLEPAKWDDVKSRFSDAGLKSLVELASQTKMVNVNPLYETNLLALPGGGWEVRNIKVLLDTRGLPGNPYQYLVFSLTKDCLIADVRFAIDRQQYENVFKPSDQLQDFAYRQQILQFVEIFRTAYNRKDIDFLKGVYSEDALIIVGKVLKAKPGTNDFLASSHLSRDKIQFIKESKQEYITKLAKVFEKNEYIKVGFDEIELRRHPQFELIYGVTLKQDWKSSSYSDTGWLFLMIDFRNPDQPLIHVRSWQPERFSDGSVVSLGDFEVIE